MLPILVFLISFLFLAAKENLSSVTENDPSTLVDGVSVITGDFYLGEEDYIVAGAEPIPLRRFYISRTGGIGQYPHLKAELAILINDIIVREPNGTSVSYSLEERALAPHFIGDDFYRKKKQEIRYLANPCIKSLPGITNTSSGEISAKSQLKNQTIIFDPKKDPKGKSFSLYAADGTIRRYVNVLSQEKQDLGFGTTGYMIYRYHLASETLPNGHMLHYIWDDENHLRGMRTTNPQNTKTFASILCSKSDGKNKTETFTSKGSDQRTLSCRYCKKNKQLTQIISPENATQSFSYQGDLLTQISLPNGSTLAIQYEDRKVKALLSPTGQNNQFIPYYTFFYFPKEKTSYTLDAQGNKTTYFWNQEERIIRKERFEKETTLKSYEIFTWEGTNLKSRELYDERHNLLYAKSLLYDSSGNVLTETIWSDHTSPSITTNQYNERNLLTEKNTPSGLITLYTYLPNTNLLASKTLKSIDQIFSQTIYSYNEDNILIQETLIDGTIASKTTQITPLNKQPYLGLPEWIIEKGENLLKKTKLSYREGALISQKEIYDADDQFRYSLYFNYDTQGRLTEETNAQGQKAIYQYDNAGNRIYAKDFSGRSETYYTYDRCNQLTKKTEIGFDGITQEFSYAYDEKHHPVLRIDPNGNTTQYQYDLFGNRTKITDSEGHETTSQYDPLGNETHHIDEDCHETITTYNAHGKKLRIQHPNGGIEINTYRPDGSLESHEDPLGMITYEQYDALGRLIKRQKQDAIETYTYDGSFLTSQTNAEGITTHYRYDQSGRKISETTEEETLEFIYDNLGRIASQKQGDLLTSYTYDLLNQPLEIKKTDLPGKILQLTHYEYDASGSQTVFRKGLFFQEKTEYDSLNRPIRKADPLGVIETISYGTIHNTLNQKVEQRTTTDSEGLQIIETFDTMGRLSTLEKRKGTTLLLEQFSYDARGNKREQRLDNTVIAQWEYNAQGLVEKIREGNGSKVTSYEYDLKGQKRRITKPDGKKLFYEYTPLGHVKRLYSSDGSVDHAIQTDRLGRITEFDGIKRTLNFRGQILEEQSSQVPPIFKEYDFRGRVKALNFLFLEVLYTHGPSHLEKVEIGPISHLFTKYDLADNLLEESTLAGPIRHTYDAALRCTEIQAPYFSQKVERFDSLGNILKMSIHGSPQEYTYDPLYQLTSETAPISHTYTYDNRHNLLTKDEKVYRANALNQLQEDFIYDQNGNPIQIGEIKLQYDTLNRLIQVETAKEKQTMTYDYLNRCISKTVNEGKPIYFIYDGQNEIGSWDGQLQEFRVLGKSVHAEISSTVALFLEDSWHIPIHDMQGNLATLIPLSGDQVGYYRYSAFGEEPPENLQISPWRFSSKRQDPATGLINYGRRYYLPALGRWLTPDPLGFIDGINLYAFVQNDPLTHFDEYGLFRIPLTYIPVQDPAAPSNRFTTATIHEAGNQACDIGRFFASAPYQAERGFNYLTGRENTYFSNWNEKQNQFFNQTANWMYRAIPTDRTHPDYLTYRSHIGTGLNIASLAAGGYSLARGGLRAMQWGVSTWRIKNGAYIATQKLASKEVHFVSRGAESVNAQIYLNKKLRQLCSSQKEFSQLKTLPDGRIRYYKSERPSKFPGSTQGSCYVTEHNPGTGQIRAWNECYDRLGNINRVHPKNINGRVIISSHYPMTGKELLP